MSDTKNIKHSYGYSPKKPGAYESLFEEGYFEHYTDDEINRLSYSNRILIDGADENYSDFVDKALGGKYNGDGLHNKSKIIYLGKVGTELNNAIYKAGMNFNLTGYNVAVDSDNINHSINNHGNSEKESLRGQRQITKKDYLNIPFLLSGNTEIRYLGKNKKGQSIIAFVSRNSDGTYNLLEFINNNRRILGFETLYVNQTEEQKRLYSQAALNKPC